MLRPLAVIIAAMYLSRPGMPYEEAERYATVVQAEAKAHRFDPLSVVAIVHFETGWQPGLVSANGEDHGLGQIRARYIGACRKDKDPLNHPSAACLEQKRELLVGEENLRWVAKLITQNRKFCKQKTGTAWFPQWLASYQGLNFPAKKLWCQPKKQTFRVVKYHGQLKQELLAKGGVLKREHAAQVEQKRQESRAEAAERAESEDSPKRASPKKDSPKKDSPKKDSPKKDSSKKDSSKKDSSKKASPKKASPKRSK